MDTVTDTKALNDRLTVSYQNIFYRALLSHFTNVEGAYAVQGYSEWRADKGVAEVTIWYRIDENSPKRRIDAELSIDWNDDVPANEPSSR